jgi:hypothetical protein
MKTENIPRMSYETKNLDLEMGYFFLLIRYLKEQTFQKDFFASKNSKMFKILFLQY